MMGKQQNTRGVPPLGLDQLADRVSKKPIATNDEVASILQGLKLDRKFFMNRLDESCLKDLLQPPSAEDGIKREASRPIGQTATGDSQPEEQTAQERRITRMKTKVLQKKQAKNTKGQASDFDIYLGESLMPVLAQALDSLCRQISRMKEQGSNLDPKVRARFNPLTWLAQQLLRRHPKSSKTPRRQAIYANFRDWSDWERGRREMLRRREPIHEVFDGFVLRGVVQRQTMIDVLDSIDDTLHLDGVLKGNELMKQALCATAEDVVAPPGQCQHRRMVFFKDGGGWDFEQFWHRFAGIVMAHDVVPYSVIERGVKLKEKRAMLRVEAETARKRDEEERKQMEAEQRQKLEEYNVLYEAIQEEPTVLLILSEGKVLTGDDVRPGDAGYEFEVPPKGKHVKMLAQLLILLGFDKLDKGKAEGGEPDSPAEPEQRWWDDECSAIWCFLQKLYQVEICDGVVEQEVLAKLLVPPEEFLNLRNKVIEARDEHEDSFEGGHHHHHHAEGRKTNQKPSIETLSLELGVTMSRMEWLHRLFESFLQGDEKNPHPVCLYPEAPGAITKATMKELIMEVRPQMEEDEFEARFRRIDQDGSGMVEFDEFVAWVREDEVRVTGAAPMAKMSFEELAQVYGESIELVHYLHDCFQDKLPADKHDDYPINPLPLDKPEIRQMITELAPDMTDAEFERDYQHVTLGKKDSLEFDEFLELLPFDDLPDEIRCREPAELSAYFKEKMKMVDA